MVQYLDDPGCVYIVVEEPWPATKFGGDRRKTPGYFNWMSSWVYYMLDKKAHPSVIFTVDTRSEVIMELPEGTNITPILGAHHWNRFLAPPGPGAAVPNKISYVFEYDYKNNGRPEEHNWYENDTIEGGEPPIRFRIPFKYPYPPPSWASLSGRSCRSLAKPLPPSRVRTPTPPPNIPAEMKSEVKSQVKPELELELCPDEKDEIALQNLRRHVSEDVKPDIKSEHVVVKKEAHDDLSSKHLTSTNRSINVQRMDPESPREEMQRPQNAADALERVESAEVRTYEPRRTASAHANATATTPRNGASHEPLNSAGSSLIIPKSEPSEIPLTVPSKVKVKSPFPWVNTRRPREHDDADNKSSKRVKQE
ncbi:hypothetical protein BXZ70DRAFT_428196 [Cristinia sonorae]|uniref:Uncharacterized protein n=1 Tax=Cristinia sonorae TaxID=1940300 RepID=A0A8K0XU34_9AGAR|nr:hypothetical protein BXZ70DRAFT_428196 [Cristinia sonorae]